MSLIDELARVFNAHRVAIECAMRHNQVTVDGYQMKVDFDQRWSPDQLRGRIAAINYRDGTKRERRIYNGT